MVAWSRPPVSRHAELRISQYNRNTTLISLRFGCCRRRYVRRIYRLTLALSLLWAVAAHAQTVDEIVAKNLQRKAAPKCNR